MLRQQPREPAVAFASIELAKIIDLASSLMVVMRGFKLIDVRTMSLASGHERSENGGMDIIGKYLRLRRELLEPLPRSPELTMRRQRVTQDLARTVAELEDGQPEHVPFLETMPWSDTISMSYELQAGRLTI